MDNNIQMNPVTKKKSPIPFIIGGAVALIGIICVIALVSFFIHKSKTSFSSFPELKQVLSAQALDIMKNKKGGDYDLRETTDEETGYSYNDYTFDDVVIDSVHYHRVIVLERKDIGIRKVVVYYRANDNAGLFKPTLQKYLDYFGKNKKVDYISNDTYTWNYGEYGELMISGGTDGVTFTRSF